MTGRVRLGALAGCIAMLGAACGGREVAVAPGDVSPELVVRAEVVARDGVAEVRPPHSATVLSVAVAEGVRVVRGEELAQLESALGLEPIVLRAPIDGVVLVRRASVGDDVGPADPPLFELADPDHVLLRFELEDQDGDRVEVGAAAIARALEQGETLAETQVSRLSARMEERTLGRGDARVRATGRVRVGWAEIAGDAAFPIGRELEVRLALPTLHAAARVPRSAIVLNEGAPVVLRPGTFGDTPVPVTVLALDRENAAIDGVAAGTRVRVP